MRVPPSELSPLFQTFSRKVALSFGVAGRLLLAAPNRVGIAFAGPSGNVNVWTDATVNSGVGFTISMSLPTLILTYAQLGPIIGGEWWGYAAGGGTIYILETWFGQGLPIEAPQVG